MDLIATERERVANVHRTASGYLTKAASHHLEAAKYHELGDHEKATECIIAANAYQSLATESQREGPTILS